MGKHGTFSGEPVTKWLTEPDDDRRMELQEEFSFTDPDGKVWLAAKGATIDGASIPRPLWSLVGSPYTGDYRRASIVHDVACDDAKNDSARREAADRMFFHACREGGCSAEQAMLLYLGVRVGADWSKVTAWKPAMVAHDTGARFQRLATEARMEVDFQHLAEIIRDQGVVDDPQLLEKRVDAVLDPLSAGSVQAP